MDCLQFDEILHDLDRSDALPNEDREAALLHAEECPRCAVILSEVESLDGELRALAEHDGEPPNGAMETRLRREFRRAGFAPPILRRWQSLAICGVAAVAILALFLFLRQPPSGRSGAGTVPDSDASRVDTAQVPQDDSLESEIEAGFIPLPAADPQAPLEDGAIVRVTLPRASLASLGFPVMEDSDSDPVAADLLLAQDGTPQAIRLVAENTQTESTQK